MQIASALSQPTTTRNSQILKFFSKQTFPPFPPLLTDRDRRRIAIRGLEHILVKKERDFGF